MGSWLRPGRNKGEVPPQFQWGVGGNFTPRGLRLVRGGNKVRRLQCKCNVWFDADVAKAEKHSGYCSYGCFDQEMLRSAVSFKSSERKKRRRKKKEKGFSKRNDSMHEYRIKSSIFYDSGEWKRLRFKVLREYGYGCMACGRKAPEVILHVDHIKPRIRYPELALDKNNLQVLCSTCNQGKGAKYEDDLRPKGLKSIF